MKARTVGTHLHVVRARKKLQTEKETGQDVHRVYREGSITVAEEQIIMKRRVRASQRWSQERTAKVETLKAQIGSNSYAIESKVIAECLLTNETHFV